MEIYNLLPDGRTLAGQKSLPYILYPPVATVSHTGDTSDFILGYINVPANALGANGAIELDVVYGVTGSAGTWVLNIKVITGTVAGTTGGTALVSGTIGAGNNTRASFLICNNNDTNSQFCYQNGAAPFTASSNTITTSAIDTTLAWTISVNAKLNSAADTIALRHLHALLYGPKA